MAVTVLLGKVSPVVLLAAQRQVRRVAAARVVPAGATVEHVASRRDGAVSQLPSDPVRHYLFAGHGERGVGVRTGALATGPAGVRPPRRIAEAPQALRGLVQRRPVAQASLPLRLQAARLPAVGDPRLRRDYLKDRAAPGAGRGHALALQLRQFGMVEPVARARAVGTPHQMRWGTPEQATAPLAGLLGTTALRQPHALHPAVPRGRLRRDDPEGRSADLTRFRHWHTQSVTTRGRSPVEPVLYSRIGVLLAAVQQLDQRVQALEGA
jgi:hypothetical protein